MSSAVRRLTQGALAPNPHIPVINARRVTMTTSLAFCANTGAPLIEVHRIAPADDPQASQDLLGDAVIEPGVTDVHYSHQPN
jgi:hypothetical protein